MTATQLAHTPAHPAPATAATAATSTKRKRTRTRNKNKSRTATAAEDDNDNDNDNDNDDSGAQGRDDNDKDAKKTLAAPADTPSTTAAPAPTDGAATKESKLAADKDSDDDDDDGEGADGDADGKRKRKRKRTRASKKGPKAEVDAVKAVEQGANLGPDPELDLRLSQHAKKAIEYAQAYSRDKASWKFNKAKQNWLLRKALACPPADYDPELAKRKPAADPAPTDAGKDGDEAANAATAGDKQEQEQEEEQEEGENFIPESFVPVVTAYLKSVMGAAKQRLLETLREALNAPVPETSADVNSAAAPPAVTEASTEATTVEAPVKKSVSFGAMAMEAEKSEDAAAAAAAAADAGQGGSEVDAKTVENRRQRARRILGGMGELMA